MVSDVTAEPAVLRSKLAGKWRTDLGYAERAGLSVERGYSPVLVSRFLRVFNEMHDAKGFNVRLPPDMILSMAPEGIGLQVLIATKNGRTLLGMSSAFWVTRRFIFSAPQTSWGVRQRLVIC